MLEDLKKRVCEANGELFAAGLVIGTFGNVSGADRQTQSMVIKPSGVPFEQLEPKDMVVVSLRTAQVTDGGLNPSSDTPTHLELYRGFAGIGGVVHTHSLYATAWAQANREIPPLGTTHADYFNGPIPITRVLEVDEIQSEYEVNTGKVVVERFADLDPMQLPGILVANHGPFAWGASPEQAVEHAVALEFIAKLATETVCVAPYPKPIITALLAKHFSRKHGADAYYGQR